MPVPTLPPVNVRCRQYDVSMPQKDTSALTPTDYCTNDDHENQQPALCESQDSPCVEQLHYHSYHGLESRPVSQRFGSRMCGILTVNIGSGGQM